MICGLDRYLLQCAWDCPCVATSMDTHVGLNVATRFCNAYPDKCWFAVLCRFWLQCSRALRELIAVYDKRTTRIQAVYLLTLPLTASSRLNVDNFGKRIFHERFPKLVESCFHSQLVDCSAGRLSGISVYCLSIALFCTLTPASRGDVL